MAPTSIVPVAVVGEEPRLAPAHSRWAAVCQGSRQRVNTATRSALQCLSLAHCPLFTHALPETGLPPLPTQAIDSTTLEGPLCSCRPHARLLQGLEQGQEPCRDLAGPPCQTGKGPHPDLLHSRTRRHHRCRHRGIRSPATHHAVLGLNGASPRSCGAAAMGQHASVPLRSQRPPQPRMPRRERPRPRCTSKGAQGKQACGRE